MSDPQLPTLLVTHHLRPAAVELLAERVTIRFALSDEQRASLGTPDLRGGVQAAIDAALRDELPSVWAVHTVGRLTREVMQRAVRLHAVVVPSSGYDNIDVPAATELGLPVINAAGSAYEPVAEHAIGLMLSVAKWIAVADRRAHVLRRGESNRAMLLTEAPTPSVLWGKRLGVIGFGFIGRSLAQKCRDAFGMDVVAYDPFFDKAGAARLGVRLTDLDEVLATCDYLSVHSPLTPQTRGLIGARELATMKTSAVLVNTARGAIVDTDALVAALDAGTIAAAALDVTEPEPLPDGHPLYSMDNVVLTPHIAGIAREYLAMNAASTARDLLAVLDGRRPERLVDPDVWPAYLRRRADLLG